jgi:DNA repair exonuclease SbcCD nuclease subunit
MRKEVVAILTADLHLSLNAPIWRSAEPDWFAAMARPLKELRKLQRKFECPVLCAGDIFDKWNSPPELINFAMDNLPKRMICVPGQHDLPLHNFDDIKKSAYWTLVQAGKISTIDRFEHVLADGPLSLYGYPFGKEIQEAPKEAELEKTIRVALAHEYVWIEGHNYTGAPSENRLGAHRLKKDNLGRFGGYNVLVYGDNHKGFQTNPLGTTTAFNCGSLMRRNSDQVDYKPMVGLLYNDGSNEPYYLDISKDKYLGVHEPMETDALNMKAFIQELEKLGDTDLDFTEAMTRYLKDNKINMAICNIILKAIGQ